MHGVLTASSGQLAAHTLPMGMFKHRCPGYAVADVIVVSDGNSTSIGCDAYVSSAQAHVVFGDALQV